MSDYKQRLGAYGEDLAANFLAGKGCRIISRNFRTAYGEIDLIAQSGDELLFVEVKTRTASGYGYPELAVNRQKISHLAKAAEIYLNKTSRRSCWRLDIVSVEINKPAKLAKIRWFKDAGNNGY
ncbi:MAG: YraN family protein [Patescibacteria group bacterium]